MWDSNTLPPQVPLSRMLIIEPFKPALQNNVSWSVLLTLLAKSDQL